MIDSDSGSPRRQAGFSQPSDSGLEAALATGMGIVSSVVCHWRDVGAEVGSLRSERRDMDPHRPSILKHRSDLLVVTRIGPFRTSTDSPPEIIRRSPSSNAASGGQTTMLGIGLPLCEAHS